MRLTPLDIKKQEFTRALRGLDAEEVQAFLNMMALQWEELLAEQRRSDDKVRELQGKLEHYQRVEEALQEALQTARENAKQALKNAEQQASLVKKEAEAEAREVKHEAQRERDQLLRDVEQLQSRRDEIVARLRAFLHAEVEMLARYDGLDSAEIRDLLPTSKASAARQTSPARELGGSTVEETPDEKAQDDLDFDPLGQDGHDVQTSDEQDNRYAVQADLHDEPAREADARHGLDLDLVDEENASDQASDDEDDEALSFRFFEPIEDEDFVVPAMRERKRSPERGPSRLRGDEEANAEATWIVRPVVSVPRGDEPDRHGESVVASNEEIEKIRRILSDLD